jgi:hypothetical protein
MLFRGISVEDKARERQERLIEPDHTAGETLHIDLFNALFTLAAYLRGYPVYLANDGVLRDASESHGCADWYDHLEKGLGLMMEYLIKVKPGKAFFYIDNPMEHCRKVMEQVHEYCHESRLEHEIVLHDSPDHVLEKAKSGILASSDSTIIDRSGLMVIDLPRAALEFHFKPNFLSLED